VPLNSRLEGKEKIEEEEEEPLLKFAELWSWV
jgi:hypothetical protein